MLFWGELIQSREGEISMQEQTDNDEFDEKILQQMRKNFILEARENLDHLNLCLIQLRETPQDESIVEVVFRIFHTLKGSSAFTGLTPITEICQKIEKYLGSVRKGDSQITVSTVDLFYEGLDLLTNMIDKIEINSEHKLDDEGYIQKIDRLKENRSDSENKLVNREDEIKTENLQELLDVYKAGYDQLSTLKHLVFASVHLSDTESLAVHLSKQIDQSMAPERNSLWLVDEDNNVVEIAKNGLITEKNGRRSLAIESSPVLSRVILEQNTVWPGSNEQIKEIWPEFDSPVIFPIKSQHEILGFLILDPEKTTEVELYQFICQFAAMIINISKLHQKVEEQRKDLDEMTTILFRQNSQLASLYHVELQLMKANNPVQLCEIVVEAVVNDLEAKRAAAFLLNSDNSEFKCVSGKNGFEDLVGERVQFAEIEAFRDCVEKGRIISQTDFKRSIEISGKTINSWIVLGLKGWEGARGIMVVEIEDEDIGDSISIITNYLGIMLDNLALKEKAERNIT
nr:hypothetical protein [uncultured bacterium]